MNGKSVFGVRVGEDQKHSFDGDSQSFTGFAKNKFADRLIKSRISYIAVYEIKYTEKDYSGFWGLLRIDYCLWNCWV